MTIYQASVLLEIYPAYDLITFVPAANGNINLKAGDPLFNNGEYTISSVASYALENGECPIKAYADAVSKNHETHFICSMGASLTSHKRAKASFIKIEIGQLVNFEGRVFEITKENNHNLGLKEII